MIHNMKLQDGPFQSISRGTKTVEMRLYDEKRQKVKVGDTIIFHHIDTDQTIETTVIALHLFSSFEELYQHFDKEVLGYQKEEIANFYDMKKYYSQTEMDLYGVVGIEIQKK